MQIGPYKLISELGQGGMAQLLLAHQVFDDGDRRSVVIKMPRRNAAADESLLRQFMEECRISRRLVHNNIISAFDSGIHEGLPYMVMDFVAGRDLAQLHHVSTVGGRGWNVEMALHVIREVGQALSHAHNLEGVGGVPAPIIHRDVAAKNVMVDGSGGVRLMDFGVATSTTTQTSKLHVKGTLRYMAPEHYLGQAGTASDVFALGLIFWELLSGRTCREGLEGHALNAAVVGGVVEPVGRQLPAEAQRLLDGMLDPNAASRLTLGELLAALEQFPVRRIALRQMLETYFGRVGKRTGLSNLHFAASKELADALAVAKAAKVPLSTPREREELCQPSNVPLDYTAADVPDTAKLEPEAVGDPFIDDELEVEVEHAPSDDTRLVTHGDEVPPTSSGPATTNGDHQVIAPTAVLELGFAAPSSALAEGTKPTEILPTPNLPPSVPDAVAATTGNSRADSVHSLPREETVTPPEWGMSAAAADHLSSAPRVTLGAEGSPTTAPAPRRRGPWVALAALVSVALGVVLWFARSWEPDLARDEAPSPDQSVAAANPPPLTSQARLAEPSTDPGGPEWALDETGEPSDLEANATTTAPTPDHEGDNLEPQPIEEAEPAAEDTPPPKATPKPSPARKARRPAKIQIQIRRGLAVDFAEVRVGRRGKIHAVPSRGAVSLDFVPGTYRLWFRSTADGAWDSKRVAFSPGMEYAGNVERSGLRVTHAPRKRGSP